jgi:hypothetical protein
MRLLAYYLELTLLVMQPIGLRGTLVICFNYYLIG